MRRILIALIVLAITSGCAVSMDYNALEGLMSARNCPKSTELMEGSESKYGSNARLVYLMDNASVNMLCGNYDKSNALLHDADDLAEDLWTKSFSKEAASFLVNDYTRPYDGEDFEKALINLFSAINYLMLDKSEDALVEIRRLDSKLEMFNSKYETKNVYKEDAFGRYLSAIIYESAGKTEDAYIDYFKAFKTFQDYKQFYNTPMPSSFIKDFLRIADATDRLDILRKELGIQSSDYPRNKDLKGYGRVVFIHLNGKSPVKVEDAVIISTSAGPVKLAFPKYSASIPSCRSSELLLKSGDRMIRSGSENVEDVTAIAVKNLDDRKVRIIAKTIARAIAKQIALKAATSQMKDKDAARAAQVIFNVADSLFISKADTRTWRILPSEIYLASVFVPEGKYDPSVSMCGRPGQSLKPVDVKAGQTRFILYDSMY